jgi:hypothetical protein
MAQAYRGAIGRTQTSTVHVTDVRGALIAVQVYTSVDATSDPDLVDRLLVPATNTQATRSDRARMVWIMIDLLQRVVG